MRLALGIAVPDHVSRTVGTPPPITSPRWIEPDESLEPGEYLVGGSTSTNLSRGRETWKFGENRFLRFIWAKLPRRSGALTSSTKNPGRRMLESRSPVENIT